MRRLSLAVIAAASTVGYSQIAAAADMPVKAPVYKAPIIAPYNWTGFYVGGNVGYSWGHTDSTVDTPDLALFLGFSGFSDSLKPKGIIGGGQIGYNWQADPHWVFGIEADFQGSGQKDSDSFSHVSFPLPGAPIVDAIILPRTLTISHEEKLTWFGTVRGRIGYIFWNNAMLYGTGGLAYGHVESSLTATLSSISGSVTSGFSGSDTKVGWTLGGGIEGPLFDSRNWTWKVEYLYIDLGTANYSFNDPIIFGAATISTDITDNIVRGGINYRF